MHQIHHVKSFKCNTREAMFNSVRFGSIRFGSVQFDSVRFSSIRFGSVGEKSSRVSLYPGWCQYNFFFQCLLKTLYKYTKASVTNIHEQLNFLGYGYGWDTHNWQYTRDNRNIWVSNRQYSKLSVLKIGCRVYCRLGTRVFQLSRVYCQLWISHPYPYPYPRKFSCSCMVTNKSLKAYQLFWDYFETLR